MPAGVAVETRSTRLQVLASVGINPASRPVLVTTSTYDTVALLGVHDLNEEAACCWALHLKRGRLSPWRLHALPIDSLRKAEDGSKVAQTPCLYLVIYASDMQLMLFRSVSRHFRSPTLRMFLACVISASHGVLLLKLSG